MDTQSDPAHGMKYSSFTTAPKKHRVKFLRVLSSKTAV